MDYKEKYEQALERARTFSQRWQGIEATDSELALRELKEIFPELKESEDEKIRKGLIDFLKSPFVNENITDEKVTPWIAWLEKQGEQKPADNIIEEEKPLLEKFKQAVYDCAWEKVTCKKEGETKEEYAERWAEQLLILVRDWADDYIDSREDAIRRRFFDKGKQSIQKPAWSEEDEKILEIVTSVLQVNFEPEERFSGYEEYMNVDLIDWLKFLKDRYTWKPSEEQITALEASYSVLKIHDTWCEDEHLPVLMSLINDLKKL